MPAKGGPTARAFQVARTQQGLPNALFRVRAPWQVPSTAGRFSDSRLTLRLLPIRSERTVDYASRISECLRSRRLQRRDRRGFSPRSRLSIPGPIALRPVGELCISERANPGNLRPGAVAVKRKNPVPDGRISAGFPASGLSTLDGPVTLQLYRKCWILGTCSRILC